MKKRNGFTLIELLAVIVILAIIALIAVPIILNIIGDTKSSSNQRSIELYGDAVEKSVATYQLNNNEKISGDFTTIDGKTLTSAITTLKVDYKGKVVCQTIQIYEDGNIYLSKCKVGQSEDYVYKKDSKTDYFTYGKKQILKPVSFKYDSWETIVKAVKEGNTSAYKVGDTKEIELTGEVAGTYTVRIANTSTPEECNTNGFSETACGFVIEFEDIITKHNMNLTATNKGGWEASKMRAYVNSDIYNALPPELKDNIIYTTVVSGRGKNDSKNFITEDKLYLFSPREIYGNESLTDEYTKNDSAKEATRQLDYYEINKVTISNNLGAIKQYEGTNADWWLRSATIVNAASFFDLRREGNTKYFDASDNYGVVPAFRIG